MEGKALAPIVSILIVLLLHSLISAVTTSGRMLVEVEFRGGDIERTRRMVMAEVKDYPEVGANHKHDPHPDDPLPPIDDPDDPLPPIDDPDDPHHHDHGDGDHDPHMQDPPIVSNPPVHVIPPHTHHHHHVSPNPTLTKNLAPVPAPLSEIKLAIPAGICC